MIFFGLKLSVGYGVCYYIGCLVWLFQLEVLCFGWFCFRSNQCGWCIGCVYCIGLVKCLQVSWLSVFRNICCFFGLSVLSILFCMWLSILLVFLMVCWFVLVIMIICVWWLVFDGWCLVKLVVLSLLMVIIIVVLFSLMICVILVCVCLLVIVVVRIVWEWGEILIFFSDVVILVVRLWLVCDSSQQSLEVSEGGVSRIFVFMFRRIVCLLKIWQQKIYLMFK